MPDEKEFITYPNTISLQQAVDRVQNWANFVANPCTLQPSQIIRSFKILKSDIVSLADIGQNPDIMAFRAYLALDTPAPNQYNPLSPPPTYRLIFVPIIESPSIGEHDVLRLADGTSTIFDLTTPCPSTCGHYDSPLRIDNPSS
jgi:hypothetical protein